MSGRLVVAVLLAVLLAGCSASIGVYHDMEGGAIAQARQPPPGLDQPYPNLANVPLAPSALPAGTQSEINARALGPDVSPPSPAALAGLTLPTTPPPLPDIPGLNLPATPSTPPPPIRRVAGPPRPPEGAPVSIAFVPGSAILPAEEAPAVAAIAAARGSATLLAGGFGDNTSLPLALSRARRLADALTAAGVPASAIQIVSAQAGSGGFVQLVY